MRWSTLSTDSTWQTIETCPLTSCKTTVLVTIDSKIQHLWQDLRKCQKKTLKVITIKVITNGRPSVTCKLHQQCQLVVIYCSSILKISARGLTGISHINCFSLHFPMSISADVKTRIPRCKNINFPAPAPCWAPIMNLHQEGPDLSMKWGRNFTSKMVKHEGNPLRYSCFCRDYICDCVCGKYLWWSVVRLLFVNFITTDTLDESLRWLCNGLPRHFRVWLRPNPKVVVVWVVLCDATSPPPPPPPKPRFINKNGCYLGSMGWYLCDFFLGVFAVGSRSDP